MASSDVIDEVLAEDNWQRMNLERCGLSILEVEEALELGVDYHELSAFLDKHQSKCEPMLACRILAKR